MELTYDQKRKYFEVRHPGQRIPARDKVAVCCAMHDEKNPSCTLFFDGNGGYHCNACGAGGNLFQFEARFSSCSMQQAELNVAEITGAKPSRSWGDLGPPVAFYDYRDENAEVLFQKRRFQPPLGKKTFRIFHPTDKGWAIGIDPDGGPPTRRVLFNLPALVKANVAFLCEGEKDCINVGNANLFASFGYSIACTCTFAGAGKEGESPKWLETYNPYFAGKQVFIFADNDEPGRVYAEAAAAGISRLAYRVRIITFPELPSGGDVSDYLELHTVAELEEKIKSAPVWTGQSSNRKSWIVEAVAWSTTASPETEYLIDGVIQTDANGIIAAEPKTGKSLAALDMLISLACGTSWLGRAVPRRVRCAYISREDSPVLTKARVAGFLRGKGVGLDAIGSVVDPTGWLWCNTREQLGDFNIDDDEHLAIMAYDLGERGIEFTILDVLNRIHNRDENNNSEMAAVVKRIDQMGREAGCRIGLVHHVSKETGGGRFFTRIRGASAIHGWTEWSIGLSLENPNSEGVKLIRKAEFEAKVETCTPILFTVEFVGGNLHLEVEDLATVYGSGSNKRRWE